MIKAILGLLAFVTVALWVRFTYAHIIERTQAGELNYYQLRYSVPRAVQREALRNALRNWQEEMDYRDYVMGIDVPTDASDSRVRSNRGR